MNNFYSKIKKPLGIFLILIGLILHLIPLFPAGWIIVLGLELAGLRILFQDKLKNTYHSAKIARLAKKEASQNSSSFKNVNVGEDLHKKT